MGESILSLRIIKTAVGLIGICGNALVCLVIYKIAFMHTTTNTFIFNQALIDFMGSLILLLSSNIPTPFPINDDLAGHILCRLWLSDFFLWSFFTASTLNLVSLTFERYVAIVFPFKHGTIYGRVPVRVLIALAWIIGTASSFYDVAFYSVQDGKCRTINVPGSQAVGVWIFLLQYFIPVCAMLFAYLHIIMVLQRSARRVGPQPAGDQPAGQAEGAEESLHRASRNTLKTLLIVFITYACCWTLNAVIFFMFNFGYSLDFSGAIYIISVALVASNSCANPIIYAVKYRQFRRALRKLLGKSATGNDDSSTSASARVI